MNTQLIYELLGPETPEPEQEISSYFLIAWNGK